MEPMALNKSAASPKPDRRKSVLVGAAVAVTLSVLLPPWLYVFDRSATSDRAGGHWEVSAGYAPIFRPPQAGDLASRDDRYFEYRASAGVRLDMARLVTEWVCVLAVSGAAWGLAQLNRQWPADTVAGPETS